jgi:hypothetical protein
MTHGITCPYCHQPTIATVTFRDATGALTARCIRCGAAESEPEQPIAPSRPAARGRAQISTPVTPGKP